MNAHAPVTAVRTPVDRAPAEVTLSVCIPTYNRAAFLDHLLARAAETWDFDFTYEIVISDNASTDGTPEVVRKHVEAGLPIRFFRQDLNKGGEINVLSAFRRGRGRYLVYLGDDDLLIPDALRASIAYLERNPEIRALYAPWELYDDVSKRTEGQFYALATDEVFGPGQEIKLFNTLITHHIFPESVVYRADAMRNITPPRRFCYWAFTYLAHVLASGPVAFAARPFYRSVTATPLETGRTQAGFEQAMVDWDTYRGGLEYFIYALLKRKPVELARDQRVAIRDVIDGFIEARMKVALRLWLGRGDYLRAHDLLCRLRYLDPDATVDLVDGMNFALPVFAQTLARLANGIAGLSSIVVASDDIVDTMRAVLANLGLRPDIAVGPADETATAADSMVVITHEADRQRFVDLGFLPGLIISEAELMGEISVA